MKTFKLWIHIESIDEEKDEYEDLTSNGTVCPECCGEYSTLEDAIHAAKIYGENRYASHE